jgi:hypothetical protein
MQCPADALEGASTNQIIVCTLRYAVNRLAGTLAAHWQAAAMLSTGKPFRCRELIQAGLGAAVDKARHELGAYGGKGVVVVTGSLHAVAAALKQLQLQ